MKTPLRPGTACVWIMLALFALVDASAQRQLFWRYGASEGLRNLNVRCLLQDRTGYLWVGTDNGLFRYDGGSFQAFGHNEGLANTEVIKLAESPDGVIWAATEGGLTRFSGKRFESVETGKTGETNGVAFDDSGGVYVSYRTEIRRGVRDGAGAYHFTEIVRGDIWGLAILNGELTFGDANDLMHLVGGAPQSIGRVAGLPADRWDAVVLDSLGNLWARSTTQLFELAKGTSRFVDHSKGVPHTDEGRLFADHHGRVYVPGLTGLVILDAAGAKLLDAAHGLPGDIAGPVLVDHEESLWLGVSGAGLVRRLGHGEWDSWTQADGLLSNSVWAIRTDSAGKLWVGTSRGLTIFGADGKVTANWTTRNGLDGDRVSSILPGLAGDFYAGTDPAGISHFDKNGRLLKTYGDESGIEADQISSMVLDGEHRLWAMGKGGCYRTRAPVDSGEEMRFDEVKVPGIPAPGSFREGIVDKTGKVWIASSEGLLQFDGKQWTIYREHEGLKANDLASVVMGPEAIWVGYRDALGMTRLGLGPKAGQVNHVTRQDGLSSNVVYALAFDGEGRLWVSTDAGVSVLEDGLVRRRYGSENGLIWNDTNGHALTIDAKGDVWVGTSGGMSRYTPPLYPLPEVPPTVVLTSVRSVSHDWKPGESPVLPYSERSLYIRYAALSYEAQSEMRFRYRLNGYDKGWNETTERSVHFAALPAEDYVFQVEAAGPSGVWSPVPASFAFSIKPAWWQTWWFSAGCLVVAALLGYTFWSLRVRAFVAQKQLLEQQVAERTAELSESHRQLEEIAYFDILTSLPNRRMFTEEFRKRLAMARRPHEPFALLLIDLDHFKQINDTYGHHAGDAVLVETSCLLRGIVRESDCVARLGGDEFAVLLFTAQDADTVETVCRRILDSFSEGIRFEGASLSVGCSIGIAMYPEHGETQESLYRSADAALYDAKRSGRSVFCWHRQPVED